jgi:two-component system chemotaxis response regulator CheB
VTRRDIVVIGASAGGLQPLTTILSRLPSSLPACVLVVMHSGEASAGLPGILARSSALPVSFAKTGPLVSGRVFVAPPDFHLLVTADGLNVVHGPLENGFRPAIDPLFRTAGREHGPRVVGVVLSGALSDGTHGLSVIKRYGGVAIVQDPRDAWFASMPFSAVTFVDVDHVLEAPQIAGCLDRLCRPNDHQPHDVVPERLDGAQRDALDEALRSALRVLEDQAELKARMARRAAEGGLTVVSEGFAKGAREAHAQAQRLRSVLVELGHGRTRTRREAG